MRGQQRAGRPNASAGLASYIAEYALIFTAFARTDDVGNDGLRCDDKPPTTHDWATSAQPQLMHHGFGSGRRGSGHHLGLPGFRSECCEQREDDGTGASHQRHAESIVTVQFVSEDDL